MKQEQPAFEASVLVFREEPTWSEDQMWTALALEMDVRGYGPTHQDAVNDLLEMLVAQVSFAVQRGHPETLWHPAEKKFWEMDESPRILSCTIGQGGNRS